ncbi:hypothetical protein [Spiroplasma melliferum]|uniref:Uncharacterized protein n=2 Tax=Spiroplasma melliferum TaxID=2134 RepID=A0AAI9X0P0_SPIME|nr:hypothetical protein [Spiroplasma melliferum]ELL44221.1 hypothetical protein SMIPMB4A_v3c8520 [Spiroplasma melliferum IPMB4A]KAI92258.1 hypothetical protein SPM_005910 [Spiroplasma melliferum KC3]QCO23682.1 hypothetical protein SRED_002153 [Spiroplasma melliferum]
MEITSGFKTTLKKSYKSIKKRINIFLKKLGFSKKKTYEVSNQVVTEMYGTIGRYVQKNIDDQIEPKSFGQGTIKNNLELFNQTSGLPSYSEAIINSQSDNQVSGLPSYSEIKPQLPTYEEAVANIKPFDEERARRYKELLHEMNIFFAKEAFKVTGKNWPSKVKQAKPLSQLKIGQNGIVDVEENEIYSL